MGYYDFGHEPVKFIEIDVGENWTTGGRSMGAENCGFPGFPGFTSHNTSFGNVTKQRND